jgi:hypothetical protein
MQRAAIEQAVRETCAGRTAGPVRDSRPNWSAVSNWSRWWAKVAWSIATYLTPLEQASQRLLGEHRGDGGPTRLIAGARGRMAVSMAPDRLPEVSIAPSPPSARCAKPFSPRSWSRARWARSPASPPASPRSPGCRGGLRGVARVSRRPVRHCVQPRRGPRSASCCWATTGNLQAGQEVERTGRVMDVAVGDGLLGRVIDPLGRPLDGRGAVATTERLPIERPAAAIMDRAPVTVPLQTGLKVHRCAHSHRARPARVDPGRPPDRQDGDRPRHHPEPARPGCAVRLLRHRPACLRRGQGRGQTCARRARWPTPSWW